MASSDNYKFLREWHLARLRNLALVEAEELSKTLSDRTLELVTPARLIALDQEVVGKRVDDRWASARTGVESTRFLLTSLSVVWFALQYVAVIVLSLSSGGVSTGFGKFVDITVLSLWAHPSKPHSLLEQSCFFSFFYLPILFLAITPARSLLRSPLLRVRKPQIVRCTRFLTRDISSSLLCVLVVAACAVLSRVGSGNESLDSNFLLAWGAVILTLMLCSTKMLQANSSAATEILAALNEGSSTKSPQTDSDDMILSANSAVELVELLKEREHSIADFSRTVLMSLDESLLIKAVSPSCLAQWGLLENELLEKTVLSLVLPNDSSKILEGLQKNTEPIQLELRMFNGDRNLIDLHWHVEWSPRYQRYFVACDDVTDRMTLERTRAEFIAELAHDMRTPLSSVALSLTSLLDGVFGILTPEAAQFARVGERNLVRVVELIDEILQAEQLRTRKLRLEFSSVNLLKLCSMIADELNPIAAERGVTIHTIDLDVDVVADERLLIRAIRNMVSNAVSFSPVDGRVDISCEEKDRAITVRIKDEGPGVPEEYQSVIFERFGVARRRTEQKRISTGLGLSICREIVMAHNGVIGVFSEQGKGSTFWFTIPRGADQTCV